MLHTTISIALQPTGIGLSEAFTIVRFDHDTITYRTTPGSDGISYEVILRRID